MVLPSFLGEGEHDATAPLSQEMGFCLHDTAKPMI